MITNNEGGALIIVVKLLRTDTTLDLSQKARVVRIQRRFAGPIYTAFISHARTIGLFVCLFGRSHPHKYLDNNRAQNPQTEQCLNYL